MLKSKPHQSRKVFSLIIGAIALQACSGTHAKPDACKLIDPATSAKVLGTEVTIKPIDTQAAGPEAASLCSYQTGSIHGGFLLAAGRLDANDLRSEVARQKKAAAERTGPPRVNLPKPKVSDVSGVGEAAFLVTSEMSFELHVFAHGDKIVLSRSARPTAAAVKQAKILARLAVTNLP